MQCECLDKSRQHSCTDDDADVEARGDEPGVEEIGGRVGAALWLRAEEILPHCSSEPGIIASTGRFLSIPRSSVRFRLKPDTSNSHEFELHRPSNKGTKLLLKVIKAIIIITQACCPAIVDVHCAKNTHTMRSLSPQHRQRHMCIYWRLPQTHSTIVDTLGFF